MSSLLKAMAHKACISQSYELTSWLGAFQGSICFYQPILTSLSCFAFLILNFVTLIQNLCTLPDGALPDSPVAVLCHSSSTPHLMRSLTAKSHYLCFCPLATLLSAAGQTLTTSFGRRLSLIRTRCPSKHNLHSTKVEDICCCLVSLHNVV